MLVIGVTPSQWPQIVIVYSAGHVETVYGPFSSVDTAMDFIDEMRLADKAKGIEHRSYKTTKLVPAEMAVR